MSRTRQGEPAAVLYRFLTSRPVAWSRGRTEPVPRSDPRGCCPILVVEDEPRIREIVACLPRLGRVRGRRRRQTGDSALVAFDADPPDLVVVDLLLPGLAGEALIRAIRDVSDVPILVASAKRSDDQRIEGLRLGADDYLPKPYNPVELVERVRAILRRARPAETDVAPARLRTRTTCRGPRRPARSGRTIAGGD